MLFYVQNIFTKVIFNYNVKNRIRNDISLFPFSLKIEVTRLPATGIYFIKTFYKNCIKNSIKTDSTCTSTNKLLLFTKGVNPGSEESWGSKSKKSALFFNARLIAIFLEHYVLHQVFFPREHTRNVPICISIHIILFVNILSLS